MKDGSINLVDNGLASAILNPEGTRGTLVARAHGDIDIFSMAVRYSFYTPVPTTAPASDPLVPVPKTLDQRARLDSGSASGCPAPRVPPAQGCVIEMQSSS